MTRRHRNLYFGALSGCGGRSVCGATHPSYMWCLLLVSLAICFCDLSPACAADPDAAGFAFFETKIRPVLVEHCYQCHSAQAQSNKKLKGGLQLDTRAASLKGGESGPAVVPGKPEKSELLAALRYDGFEMPPGGKLSAAVITDFEKWIRMGAPDPRDGKAEVQQAIDWNKAREFWAFQLPTRHAPPQVQNESWPRNDIDRFILSRLEANGLKPVAAADKRTLIRRATFDLTGLPPTIEETAEFIADDSPTAFQKVVDRLLESPHYGERWGRYWLDVARYADDKALAYHNPWTHAWRYRDWVVKALNDDMPYDRFVRLQLAGDLLKEPKTDYTLRLAGLGFQGLGALYHKGSVAEQVIADELDDRVDTLSRGLLGLTVACARCHDHKYDPIPTRDYYSLASAYFGAQWSEVALVPPDVIARYEAGQNRIKQQDAAIKSRLREIATAKGETQFGNISRYMLVAWRINVLEASGVKVSVAEIAAQQKLHPYYLPRFRDFLKPAHRDETVKWFPQLKTWFDHDPGDRKSETYDDVQVPDAIRELADRLQESAEAAIRRRQEIQPKKLEKVPAQLLTSLLHNGTGPLFADEDNTEKQLLDESQKQELVAMRAELEKRTKSAPAKYAIAHGVTGGGKAMPIYIRGNVNRKGETAPPSFLRILRQPEAAADKPFTRMELADAICSPNNPLTARVIVNRVWQHHFGRGIVASGSNFGLVGDRPTHPELLDTLAVRFMEAGWSLKWLHREIMLSATYQLGSGKETRNMTSDPGNHLLWRYSPRRLDVEAWRDAILAVSGRLDRTLGGPAVGATNTGHVRRTLYGTVSRREPDKMLVAFDFPDANVSKARRDVTTVPQQQLFVLNSDFMIQAAEALASRMEKAADTEEERIELAYRWAYSRNPTADELQFSQAFLRLAGENSGEERLSAWGQFAQAMLAANEFAWID